MAERSQFWIIAKYIVELAAGGSQLPSVIELPRYEPLNGHEKSAIDWIVAGCNGPCPVDVEAIIKSALADPVKSLPPPVDIGAIIKSALDDPDKEIVDKEIVILDADDVENSLNSTVQTRPGRGRGAARALNTSVGKRQPVQSTRNIMFDEAHGMRNARTPPARGSARKRLAKSAHAAPAKKRSLDDEESGDDSWSLPLNLPPTNVKKSSGTPVLKESTLKTATDSQSSLTAIRLAEKTGGADIVDKSARRQSGVIMAPTMVIGPPIGNITAPPHKSSVVADKSQPVIAAADAAVDAVAAAVGRRPQFVSALEKSATELEELIENNFEDPNDTVVIFGMFRDAVDELVNEFTDKVINH